MLHLAALILILLTFSCQSTPTFDKNVETRSIADSSTSLPLQALPLFEEPKGAFNVYFPSPPQHSTYSSEVDIGTLEMPQWVSKDASGQFYILSYVDYPKAVLKLGSAKQLLKGVEERLLSTLHARQTSRQSILLDSLHNGVAFQALAKRRHWYLNYQLYLVKNRLYQLGIHSAIGPISQQDSLDFFGSFKIVE